MEQITSALLVSIAFLNNGDEGMGVYDIFMVSSSFNILSFMKN